MVCCAGKDRKLDLPLLDKENQVKSLPAVVNVLDDDCIFVRPLQDVIVSLYECRGPREVTDEMPNNNPRPWAACPSVGQVDLSLRH